MLNSWSLYDLVSHLRRERLFVSSEQTNLQSLNEKLKYTSTHLAQLAWISSHQRINLNHLILAKIDCLPALNCQRNYTLEKVTFTEATKVLGYQDGLRYGEFLSALRDSWELVATALASGDKNFPEAVPDVLHSLYRGLYGSCLLAEDKLLVLKLLQHLTVLQLVPSDNPRRLLRHGTCAFARFYSVFHENLYSAKLFLTAALHGPIMKLLMEDEMFLDIDPDKAAVRYPPEERMRKFGPDGTPEHAIKLQRYRDWTIKRLFYLSEYFIYSIRDNMHCFPTSVCWLVRQMAGSFAKSGCLGEKEIFEICLDLVFTYFICPAIVNPEPYGITDAPIGYVARFNLMQVAQILQMLAMRKYEDVDPKVRDLYSQFRSDSVSSLLDGILEDRTDFVEEEPLRTDDNPDIEGITRSVAFFTYSQLNGLVSFLQNLLSVDDESINKSQLESLLSRLPPLLTNGHNKSFGSKHQPDNFANAESSNSHKPVGILRKVGKQRNVSSGSTVNGGNAGLVDAVDEFRLAEDDTPEWVLIFSLAEGDAETIGLMSEQKVLELEEKRRVDPIPIDVAVDRDITKGLTVDRHRVDTQEKRTRFSLSHDEGSIGNTSDNLEAVSEAASNHSGASSLESENEDQNDNLSDMVSANVSGRGTPNISGRDTPSSQVTEGDEGRAGEGEEIRTSASEHRQTVATVSKQTRSDIDDKFGKFEIKKQEMSGDETISLVSDTWSTDVLASDSETVEQSERLFPRPPDDGLPHPFIRHSLDISETASEAWSTDVLASDSERLTEVDTDDTASVARSDDTAHSESGIRIETEGGETPPPASHLGAAFRPIREPVMSVGRISLAVPPSPTKADNWASSAKTGGRPDCRRRTLEYLDSGTFKGFNKSGRDSMDGNRLIHVIDKMDSKSCCTSSGYVKSGRNGTIGCSKSPSQPHPQSQTESLPNGIVNPLSDSGDQAQRSLGESSGLSSTDSDAGPVPSVSEKIGEINEENRRLFDDGDTTPPSPLLSNPVISRSSLSSSSTTFVGNHKVETSYRLSSNTYNDVKSKQEMEDSERVFLSSTSLASTSSSGSNSGRAFETQAVVRNVDRIQVSTGAIPKSISFDKTAERGDKELADEDQKQKKGFFRNLKMSFKNRRGKHLKGDDAGRFHDQTFIGDNTDGYGLSPRLQRGSSEDGGHPEGDAIEDILAKYRGKQLAGPEEIIISADPIRKKSSDLDDDQGLSDESIFLNAKRKLRLVFSSSDVSSFDATPIGKTEDELVSFLNLQLAEAINLQNRSLVSQLHEALRCVKLFDDEGCRRLFKSLKEDYQSRAPYVAYLVRSRQKLLLALSHFQRMKERLESDARVCRKFLVALCARIFLERREESCRCFTLDFQQLTLADEKTDLLDKFLKELFNQLEKDQNWQGIIGT